MSKDAAKKKKERIAAFHDLTHGYAVYIISWIVPLIIMIAIFAMRKIYPFGENCYLRSDMYHQYCPFFSELWEKLRTGDSLFYSWDIGMGTNFLAIFGYYLSSPTNWFIALFPQKNMIEIMNVIILLKLATSSFTCTYYLCRHNRRIHISAAVFGLFYSLSAFIAAYSWNLMWLDCVLLLPLVVLGLERLVKEGKGILYAVTLGLTILSNYYIAIMVCISMVIYFVVITVSMPVPKDKLDYPRAFLRFILYSLLAGGLAAILLLPEMYALGLTASSDISFPTVMTRYFSFITIISRHLINTDVSIGLDHLPNIYCGVAVLLLFPLYIMTKKIPAREKIMKVIALFIFFTAFNMNIPNFVWHGFHYPNSLPCRQSFIYICILLTICYDAFKEIRRTKSAQLTGSLWGVLLLLIYLGNTFTDDELNFRILYISAIFIAIYALLMFFIQKKKTGNTIVTLVLYAVAIIECTINMESTGYSTTSRTYYLRDYDAVENVVAHTYETDPSFYRLSKAIGYRTKNDGAFHNFRSPSTFSSTSYAGVTALFGDLGMEHSTNAYAANGATPLVYSMLNIKYLISNKIIEPDGIFTFEYGYDGEFIYKNNYCLPIAYMVPSDLEENWIYKTDTNPFNVQNNFVTLTTGITDLFTPIDYIDDYSTATIIPAQNEHVFLYVKNKSVSSISVSIDGEAVTYDGINHGRMVDLGYVAAGAQIYISDADANGYDLQLLAYTMDVDKYTEAMTTLLAGGIEITSHDSTSLEGTIYAEKDGLCFTSIPYDESFTITVDGKEIEYKTVGGAFISFDLTAGTHTIRFRYFPRGFKAGIVISAISLVLLGGCIAFRIKFKKEFTEPDKEPVIPAPDTSVQEQKETQPKTIEDRKETQS